MSSTTENEVPVERKERKESEMSKSFSRMTSKLDGGDKEYAWGCVLSKEAEEYDWDHEEEDDDEDYCQHTLMPRTAVLGKTAKEGERNIVEVVTKDYNGKELTCPILSLTLGRTDMVCFDLSFSGMAPVKFRLVEGSGPVHMTGIDLVQYPEDPAGAMLEYTDAEEYEEEDEDDMEATETEGDEETSTKKGAKRKGGKQGGKGKKGRMDSSAISTGEDEVDDNESEESDEEEEDMEDDVDSDEEEEDESEEIESSPEKPKSKKKGSKESKGKAQTKVKKSSKSPAKAKKEKSKPQKLGRKARSKKCRQLTSFPSITVTWK